MVNNSINKLTKIFSTVLSAFLPAVLVLQPLLMILRTGFYQENTFNPLLALDYLTQKNLSDVVFNSIWLGISVVACSTALAFPMAYIMAKTWLSRHNWLDIILLIPFMTPPYIGSMGWILFMQPRGYLEQLFPRFSGVSHSFFSFFGLVMVMSLHLSPFIYLILKNTLRRLAGSLEEAGAVHGADFFYRLRKIILPLLVPSYGAGALLIFVKTISEFGTPATMGRRIGFYVLTTEIHGLTSNWPIDFGKASILSSLLLCICLLTWYINNQLGNRFGRSLVGPKGSRIRLSIPGLPGKVLILCYVCCLLVLSVGIPYFSVIITSLLKLQGYGLTQGNFTVDHYRQILTWGSRGLLALFASLKLAFFSATIATIIGTFLALEAAKGKNRIHRYIDFSSLLPNTVPSIVMIVGLILFWNAPWMKLPVYNTYAMVLITYVVLFLPFSTQYVKTVYNELDQSLLQAGRVFGGSPPYVFRRILLPLIMPGVLSGWIMTFIISLRELVASLMILPPGMENSARFIYGQFEQGSNAETKITVGVSRSYITSVMTKKYMLLN